MIDIKQKEWQTFYYKNYTLVDQYVLSHYKKDWNTLAKEMGESDEQGKVKQFMFFVRKLNSIQIVRHQDYSLERLIKANELDCFVRGMI